MVERVWSYRAVEKAPLDIQKLGNSREFGIAIKGSFDRNRKFNYHFMLGNGNANNSEVGKGKKAMVSLSAIPAAGLVVEGYADFDDHPNGKRRMTFQGFAGLELEKIRFGLQYAHQFRRQGRGLDDMSLRILSVFSVARLSGQANAIVRLDRMFDSNPDGATISYIPFDPNVSFNFLLVGWDINA